MNYKEVLKCLKMPNYVSNDFYSMLFARSIGGTAGYDELTGTPPLTFTANGRNLIDYRIYGANDGVGERSIPYGYQVNTVVRSENLFDGEYPDIDLVGTTLKYRTIYVGDGDFTLSTNIPQDTTAILFFLAGNVSSGAATNINGVWLGRVRTVRAVNGFVTIAYRCFPGRDPRDSETVLTEGSTAPAQYIPYSRTDIPIYIGDTPLAQGEYVDYGEQKVYKYVGGVLTPTEPPVELPALPTIDGTTIVDFDNTPKPSEMYIKYPK